MEKIFTGQKAQQLGCTSKKCEILHFFHVKENPVFLPLFCMVALIFFGLFCSALHIYILLPYSFFFRKAIFDGNEDDPNYNPLPEDRPGGFNWGEGQRAGERDERDHQD